MRLKLPSALGCLLCVAASPPPQVALTEFASYCELGRALWGRSLCGPLMLVDPQSRAAIANKDPGVPGFSPQAGFWSGTLAPTVPLANTSVELGGRRIAEVLLPLPEDAIERRILLSHEAFHRIQPDLGSRLREADNGHLDAKDGRIYARLEAAALGQALTGRNWRQAARAALSYRSARLVRFSGAAAAETSLINNEGLAEYTGIKVGARGRETDFALRRLRSITVRPSLIRSFGYVVGPAYALLLDRLPGKWRADAIEGRALPDLLRERIGAGPQVPSLSSYGSERIIAEETARDTGIQQRRTALRIALVTGPTVTFPFQAMQIAFNPNTLFSLGEAGSVYGPGTTIHDKWGSLDVTGAVLLSPARSFARVPGPAAISGGQLVGSGWTAQLAPGYVVADGPKGQVVTRQN